MKAEKNRCARNCFVCPCCTHILSVLASDLNDMGESDLLSSSASQGQPPYYLGCSVCKWDSKSLGLVFDKPTGLSLQLQRQENSGYDVLEFERLKDHFDPFIKTQTQAAVVSAAVGAGKSRPVSGPGNISEAVAAAKNSRSNATNDAASAALNKSKLLRDLSSLSSSKYLSSQAGLKHSYRVDKVEREELKHYEALTSWTSSNPVSSSDQTVHGAMGKREKHQRDYIANVKPTALNPAASVDDKITSLAQRWNSLTDQPRRVHDLRPTRVPLQAKQSKRCPTCKHIVIKPDLKAASNRFKIKLVAMNYLPEFQLGLAPEQPLLTMLTAAPKLDQDFRGGFDSLSVSSNVRKAPGHSVTSSGTAVSGSSHLPAALTSNDVDLNRLLPGQTYSFQLDVTNPLDDPLRVKVVFVRVLPPSLTSTAPTNGVKELRDSRYIFAPSKTNEICAHGSTTLASTSSITGDSLNVDEGDSRSRLRSRFGWRVYPSSTAFPLNAFNEVWELEEPEELLNTKLGAENTVPYTFDSSNEHEEVMSDFSDHNGDEGDEKGDTASLKPFASVNVQRSQSVKAGATTVGSKGQRRPFVQKGHTTKLPLDLTISKRDAPPPGHPIEIAMHVTFSYSVDGVAASSQGASQPARKDFQFWTALRLGTMATR